MHTIRNSVIGGAFALSLMLIASPVYASGLTSGQINSVLGLLSSFGVSSAVIANVQAVLTGQSVSGNTGGQSEQGNPMIGVVRGTISANNSSSITMQTATGTSTVVDITASTTISIFTSTSTPATQGSVTDLTVGETAIAEGTQNTDGSLTALRIRAGTIPTSGQNSGSTNSNTGTSCLTLTRNLGIGSRGADVASLQQLLAQDPESGFTATSTGYFGPLTAKALARFQAQNGIASSTAIGFAGPLTRNFFQQHCVASNQGQGQRGRSAKVSGNTVTGTISANNTSSITVQASSGTSTTVDITASTTIAIFTATSTPPTSGSVSDLTVGENIRATGSLNSDGSLTAKRIIVSQI